MCSSFWEITAFCISCCHFCKCSVQNICTFLVLKSCTRQLLNAALVVSLCTTNNNMDTVFVPANNMQKMKLSQVYLSKQVYLSTVFKNIPRNKMIYFLASEEESLRRQINAVLRWNKCIYTAITTRVIL